MALDCGITECDFWNMTLGEIQRLVTSRNRVKSIQDKERAAFDYIQAQLIVKGVAAVVAGGDGMPELYEAYGVIFNDDKQKKYEEKQKLKDELSALRFKQYANFHNKKIK